MSAITKSVFAPNPMDIVSLEAKGKKSGGSGKSGKSGGSGKSGKSGGSGKSEKSEKSEGSKPKNEPKKPFMIKGPIPPKEFRDPDIIYAETNPPGLPPGKRPYEKQQNDFSESDEAAIKTVLSWKNASVYSAYAEKARSSPSSGGSGPVTYDGGKVMAVGSSSEVGSKSTAVYSTGDSNNNCIIS